MRVSPPFACQSDWSDFTEGKERNDTDIQRIHLHIMSFFLITEPAFTRQTTSRTWIELADDNTEGVKRKVFCVCGFPVWRMSELAPDLAERVVNYRRWEVSVRGPWGFLERTWIKRLALGRSRKAERKRRQRDLHPSAFPIKGVWR